MTDYKDLARRCCAVLRVIQRNDYKVPLSLTGAIDARLADWNLLETPLQEFPLPDWAESLNTTGKVCLRAQLCTKDGRQRGNARIIAIDCNNPIFPKGSVLYRVRTDIGTEINLLEEEINQMFYIGNYIMKEGQ